MSTKYDYTVIIGGVDATAVFNKMGGPAVAQRYLAGEFMLVEIPQAELSPEPAVLDFTIHVDRSVKPVYPDWMNKVMNPELELTGPTEYDLSLVDQWLHNNQKRGTVTGHKIYGHLKENGLALCLNLQDGLAIQKKGTTVFRKVFDGRAVFLWGSVVQRHFSRSCGELFVPFLYEFEGRVVIGWVCLDSPWYSSNPALRISK